MGYQQHPSLHSVASTGLKFQIPHFSPNLFNTTHSIFQVNCHWYYALASITLRLMFQRCYQPECILLSRASSRTWSKTFYRTEGRPDRRPKGQRPVVTCSLSISRLSQPHSPIASWMAYSRLYFRAREFCRYCRFGTHSSYAHDYLRIL